MLGHNCAPRGLRAQSGPAAEAADACRPPRHLTGLASAPCRQPGMAHHTRKNPLAQHFHLFFNQKHSPGRLHYRKRNAWCTTLPTVHVQFCTCPVVACTGTVLLYCTVRCQSETPPRPPAPLFCPRSHRCCKLIFKSRERTREKSREKSRERTRVLPACIFRFYHMPHPTRHHGT